MQNFNNNKPQFFSVSTHISSHKSPNQRETNKNNDVLMKSQSKTKKTEKNEQKIINFSPKIFPISNKIYRVNIIKV